MRSPSHTSLLAVLTVSVRALFVCDAISSLYAAGDNFFGQLSVGSDPNANSAFCRVRVADLLHVSAV